ncbi:DUF4190 domain-containing protein [Leucobacter sp. GX0328]
MTFDPTQPPAEPTSAQQGVAGPPDGRPAPHGAPQPPAPGLPPQHPYAQPPRGKTNTLAIIALVGSFFISLVGIVCGHIALSQIKRRGEGGRGLALAGVIIGYVVLAAQITAVIAVIVFIVLAPAGSGSAAGADAPGPTGSAPASTNGPEGMASGGAVFGAGGELISQGSTSGDERVAFDVDRTSDPVDVTIYVDYMCPICGAFEGEYGDDLETAVDAGDITLQVVPLNFLDSMSQGTNYSTRAANLFACTVENAPDAALAVHTALLSDAVQPEEQTPGLDDEELLQVAADAGADTAGPLRSCVENVAYGGFFSTNTSVFTQVGLVGLADGAQLQGPGGELQPADQPQKLTGTPTAIVSGEEFVFARDGDFADFLEKSIAERG